MTVVVEFYKVKVKNIWWPQKFNSRQHPERDVTFDLFFPNSLETQTRAKREQRINAIFQDHTP